MSVQIGPSTTENLFDIQEALKELGNSEKYIVNCLLKRTDKNGWNVIQCLRSLNQPEITKLTKKTIAFTIASAELLKIQFIDPFGSNNHSNARISSFSNS